MDGKRRPYSLFDVVIRRLVQIEHIDRICAPFDTDNPTLFICCILMSEEFYESFGFQRGTADDDPQFWSSLLDLLQQP